MSALVLTLWKEPCLRLVNGDLVDCFAECAECGGDGIVFADGYFDTVRCPDCNGLGYRALPADVARALDETFQERQLRYRVQRRLMARYGTEQPTDVRDYWRC